MDTLPEIQSRMREEPKGFDWTFGLGNWLGALGMKILYGIMAIASLLLCVYMLIQMAKSVISSIFAKRKLLLLLALQLCICFPQ
ncbi:hypothetical protein FKM82_027574 [Ascaphus truei]